MENSAKYRNTPFKASSLHGIYDKLRRHYFAKVFERPDVPPEEKTILKLLRENKPWNPYNRRHTALNEKARLVNEYDLRQHAGWTKNSDMIEIYTHDLGNESSEDLLLAYGIDVNKEGSYSKEAQQKQALLLSKTCPHCSEPNRPHAKFCLSCKMVLTLDSYTETKNEAEETKKRLEELEAKQEILQANAASFLRALMAAEVTGAKPRVEIITWNADKEGSEGLFRAAEIARAQNQKRE